jgi:hypothetical protein
MSIKPEQLVTPTILLCALAVTGMVIRRELRPVSGPSREPLPVSATRVEGWERIASSATWLTKRSTTQLVVFSDLECPFCRRLHNSILELQAVTPSRLSLGFVHFPLDGHRFAMPAARAVVCAGSSGRSAQMIDALFAKQDSLGLKEWRSYAADAGVPNAEELVRCVAGGAVPAEVRRGLELGQSLGVDGTPTVLIGGWRLSQPPTLEQLKAISKFLDGNPDVRSALHFAGIRTDQR